jgi:hypothetical protein
MWKVNVCEIIWCNVREAERVFYFHHAMPAFDFYHQMQALGVIVDAPVEVVGKGD